MKQIFVIREGEEIITARDSMNNAIAAAISRMAVCGYLCEGFDYEEDATIIVYRDTHEHETRAMVIEAVNFMEGV